MEFSIVIPAYKSRFLQEAIESVMSQTYQDYELIIVDDCSPENLKAIVDVFLDSRIRYYRNERNCGAENVVDNWNICLGYCSGDYVICMGDDDRLLPCCLEEYSKLIKKYPGIGLLHGWTEIIDESSNIIRITAQRPEFQSACSLAWHRWNSYFDQYIGDFCFNIDWLKDRGGFYKLPLAWGSDDISAIIGAMKNGVANTQSVVFQYRSNRLTISRSGNIEIKINAINMERLWFESFFTRNFTDYKDQLFIQNMKLSANHRYLKKKGCIIAHDLRINYLHLFKWLLNRNKYQISLKCIIYALILSLNIRNET